MKANDSIKCGVEECVHHAKNVNYCTLNAINVGSCQRSPKTKEETDCESFALK